MKSTRKAYGETLIALGEEDNDIVVLDADLASATQTNMFKSKFPERHINVGIAEQDLVGTASGLALMGKKVYASTFAVFLAGRAYEQIRNTVAYNNLPVKLCATHAGLTVGEDGASHQMLEDIALMRVIPNMIVLSPADEIATNKIIRNIKDYNGPVYVRLGRSDVPSIYTGNEEFKIGKSILHGDGRDAVVFATGYTVHIALEAMKELKQKKVNIKVVDIYSIKPLDKETIVDSARKAKKVITIEEHNVIGGMGSAICEVLSELLPKKVARIGIEDKFGKSGKAKEVMERYKITKERIMEEVLK
ncbi:MAG: transketolase family protein [Clostridia bacterium]|nr:transketolase family protein [Clostridia bacterium]MDD4376111.1 transketolase family protein [Clostridia bacterium]